MKPKLVVIDCKKEIYSAFVGKQRVLSVQASGSLHPEEVEEFRSDPEKFMSDSK